MRGLLPEDLASRLVLASASPRRRELIGLLGLAPEILPSDYDETMLDGVAPPEQAIANAVGKARAVARLRQGRVAIGSDTIVVADTILGKPQDHADAARMLRLLSDREHEVITAIALAENVAADGPLRDGDSDCRVLSEAVSTRVRFRALPEGEIESYLATGEYSDKAGAYGIQGFAASFVTGIDGCYFNVMGLPVERLLSLLRRW